MNVNRIPRGGARRVAATAFAVAVLLHAAFAGVLLARKGDWPDSGGRVSLLIQLDLPLESREPMYMVAAMPQPSGGRPEVELPAGGEETHKAPAAPDTPTPAPLDEETRHALESEREELKARLKAEEEEALAGPALAGLSASPLPTVAEGPVGTVRELDLGGRPQAVVDEIMSHYRMRVSTKMVGAGSSQSFLSSAATAHDRYVADRRSPAGIYQVFELSQDAVAKMSRLEEEEILRRGLNPERTRVTHVVFGIVSTGTGRFDLGILKFEAQPVDE